MFQIIGIVLLFGMVFGSYILAGGKMGSGGYRVATPLDVFVRKIG